MARSNKYTSLNLNDVFDKKLSSSSNNSNHPATTNNNPSAKSLANHTKTGISNSRIHGHMLVLTRPTPKPISIPHKPQINDKGSSFSSPSTPDKSKGNSQPGSISLRPQGSTGSNPSLTSHPLPSPVSPSPSPSSLKSDRFVPPHLRPGFVGKEEKLGPELGKGGAGSFKGKVEIRGQRPVQPQGLDPIERRPKSGGGFEPVRKGRELADLNRPGSSGTRPSSSG